MRKAFELGCTFLDIAEVFDAAENKLMVGRALAPIRETRS
jgi:aryl-alcohol dehydrogenase-like predicted oxidoreductase